MSSPKDLGVCGGLSVEAVSPHYKDGTQQHYNWIDESSWMALPDFRLALGSQAFA